MGSDHDEVYPQCGVALVNVSLRVLCAGEGEDHAAGDRSHTEPGAGEDAPGHAATGEEGEEESQDCRDRQPDGEGGLRAGAQVRQRCTGFVSVYLRLKVIPLYNLDEEVINQG